MYTDFYSEEITKKLEKLKRKDPSQYDAARKKMDQVLANPNHIYKWLHHVKLRRAEFHIFETDERMLSVSNHTLKGFQRVHTGHFVLVFKIDHNKKAVFFCDYDHHDKIYR